MGIKKSLPPVVDGDASELLELEVAEENLALFEIEDRIDELEALLYEAEMAIRRVQLQTSLFIKNGGAPSNKVYKNLLGSVSRLRERITEAEQEIDHLESCRTIYLAANE